MAGSFHLLLLMYWLVSLRLGPLPFVSWVTAKALGLSPKLEQERYHALHKLFADCNRLFCPLEFLKKFFHHFCRTPDWQFSWSRAWKWWSCIGLELVLCNHRTTPWWSWWRWLGFFEALSACHTLGEEPKDLNRSTSLKNRQYIPFSVNYSGFPVCQRCIGPSTLCPAS